MPPRNRLVHLADAAWQTLVSAASDPEAEELLAHWHQRQLPLVVRTRPAGLAAAVLAVGLPAPLRWSRRRLALQVPLGGVQRQEPFPLLAQVAALQGWSRELDRVLQALGLAPRVYGSYGWQALSGEAYVHAASDIDLQIDVPDLAAARAALAPLRSARLPGRLDGEFSLPDGSAIAWREFDHVLHSDAPAAQVLVKGPQGPRLMPAHLLRSPA